MSEESWSLTLRGVVQGLGIRPTIARLANTLALTGWVKNTNDGVEIMITGLSANLVYFKQEVQAFGSSCQLKKLNLHTFESFSFELSQNTAPLNATVAPDKATCGTCLSEFHDPHNRRFRYPFITCTQCGPRFSITEIMPYERHHTSMQSFLMCGLCQEEYRNPNDRRYHAQTISCWDCGPELILENNQRQVLSKNIDAMEQTAQALLKGKVVAVKGLGGFHIMADASQETAVERCRRLKNRPAKPFAVMVQNVSMAKKLCQISPGEAWALTQPEGSIVLARCLAHPDLELSPKIAPGLTRLGLMLPFTSLHHDLIASIGRPLVATSLNLESEAIVFEEDQILPFYALGLDLTLTHNRAIVRPIDDSVVHCLDQTVHYIRRGRGAIPFRLPVAAPKSTSVLALGGHLKNTVAYMDENYVEISAPIGDLEPLSNQLKQASEIKRLLRNRPKHVVLDLHPDFNPHANVQNFGAVMQTLQHHQAHVLAGMLEHQLSGPVLGIAWDGLGLGQDNQFWGAEIFYVEANTLERVSTFKSFQLAGGEKAVKEPKRIALSLLYNTYRDDIHLPIPKSLSLQFTEHEYKILSNMIQNNIQCPSINSVGRLFDGVAALLNVCHVNRFQGQAAMMLEDLAWQATSCHQTYPVQWMSESSKELDWRPMIRALIKDLKLQVPPSIIAAKFHQWLIEIIKEIILIWPDVPILLTGGVFQNQWLLKHVSEELKSLSRRLYTCAKIPCNDFGISMGQAYSHLVFSGSVQAEGLCA